MKHTLLSLFALCLLSLLANAQSKKEKIHEEIFSYVDTQPEFVGGRDSLIHFLETNMIFPQAATKKNIKKGKVYIQFIVKKNGEIINCKIEKTTNSVFNKETIRLVEAMPAWKAGQLNGKDVNTRYTLPIKFGHTNVLDTK